MMPYFERRVPVAIKRADEALDRFLFDLQVRNAWRGAPRALEVGSGRLLLDDRGTPLEAPTPSAIWPRRRLRGWIHGAAGWYRVRVEIELLAWSGTASVIAIRPLGRWPHPLGAGLYYRIGAEALDVVREEITGWDAAVDRPAA